MDSRFDVVRIIKVLSPLGLPCVVIVCSALLAISVNNVIAAEYLDEAVPAAVTPRHAAKPAVKRVDEAALSAKLVDRNMFCSDCVVVPEPGAPAAPTDEIPMTTLPLELVATNISEDEESSFASIVNTSSAAKGSYWSGHSIPGAGKIERIRGKYVDFHNRTTNRIERIPLLTVARTETAVASRTASYRSGPKNELQAKLDAGIKKISDTHYELDRSLVDEFRKAPTQLRGVRARPYTKNGKPMGVKLYAVRPTSPIGRLGMKNGDVIMKVNNIEMTTPDRMLAAYTKLNGASRFAVTVERRGKPVEINYTVR